MAEKKAGAKENKKVDQKSQKKEEKKKLSKLFWIIIIILLLLSIACGVFVGVRTKAKYDPDISLVKVINKTMDRTEKDLGVAYNRRMALDNAEKLGYIMEDLTPTSLDREIFWDRNSHRFVLLENGKVIYAPKNAGSSFDFVRIK